MYQRSIGVPRSWPKWRLTGWTPAKSPMLTWPTGGPTRPAKRLILVRIPVGTMCQATCQSAAAGDALPCSLVIAKLSPAPVTVVNAARRARRMDRARRQWFCADLSSLHS